MIGLCRWWDEIQGQEPAVAQDDVEKPEEAQVKSKLCYVEG